MLCYSEFGNHSQCSLKASANSDFQPEKIVKNKSLSSVLSKMAAAGRFGGWCTLRDAIALSDS